MGGHATPDRAETHLATAKSIRDVASRGGLCAAAYSAIVADAPACTVHSSGSAEEAELSVSTVPADPTAKAMTRSVEASHDAATCGTRGGYWRQHRQSGDCAPAGGALSTPQSKKAAAEHSAVAVALGCQPEAPGGTQERG